MIFFQSYPPQIQGISNLSYEFILLNGYYIVTITGGNGTVFFNQTISDFTMNVILVGGADRECLDDVEVAAKVMGVRLNRNANFIYSATNCPIK